MDGHSQSQADPGTREAGMTLVELVVVLTVVSILLGIAVPSLLGGRERAHRATAEMNVHAIVPAIHAYRLENGTYETMTLAALKADYDQSLDVDLYSFGDPGNLTADGYCVQSSSGGQTYRKGGPAVDIVPGACP
jgi:prepilin-type N-terminal cleavage/methylation domain-containing protein